MPTVAMRSSCRGGSAARRYSLGPMAERNLYLHELIDIVGEGAMRYMEHTAGFNAEAAADRGLDLVGTGSRWAPREGWRRSWTLGRWSTGGRAGAGSWEPRNRRGRRNPAL